MPGALLLLPQSLQGRRENPEVEETLVSGPQCQDRKEGDSGPPRPLARALGGGRGGQLVHASAAAPLTTRARPDPPHSLQYLRLAS